MEQDLNKVFNDLDSHFIEYMTEHGKVPNEAGFINCINPNHPDRHPSMHFIDGGAHAQTAAYCFSCHCHISILNACHFLEKKPITGVGFYEETLPYLCKKYNIDYEPIQIDNKTRDMYQKRCGVRDALNIIHGMAFVGTNLNTEHPGIKHLLNRGITEETIKKFQIGVITSYKEYLSQMANIGYTDKEWLASADLANKGIFNPDAFIIPIRDDKGRPVGFVTRTTTMAPNDKGERKYVNSINSDIYTKSELLFNFNEYNPSDGPLWIVEGYVDALFLDQSGLKNVAALGSTALTEQHVDLLSRYSVKQLILMLDGDEGGRQGVDLALKRITPYQIFRSIRIVELPEGTDPDSFVRSKGVEELKKLAHPDLALSPFAWELKKITFQDDPILVVERVIPKIAAEESTITRLKMIKELSKVTGINKEDIRKDVELQVNRESDKFVEEITEVNKHVQTALHNRKIKDTKGILEEALIKVKTIELKYNDIIDNHSSYENKRANLWTKIEHGEYKYGLYCPKFKKLEEMYDGMPYTTNLTLIGGKPGSGKTTWISALAVDLVEANEDAAVFFMTIDDTTELMTFKMLAQKTGYPTSKIKQFINLQKEEQTIIREAWSWLDKLSNNFVMADATEGTTPAHKQKTDAVSFLSEKVKEASRIYDMHLIMTTELRKMSDNDSRPTPADLKDTVQLEYDADSIIMIHNDMLVKEETNIAWQNNNIRMPILETHVWKNKHTGKTGDLAYRLNSTNLQVTEISFAEVRALKAQNAGHQVLRSSYKVQ
jgi:DNA primase catalytic core